MRVAIVHYTAPPAIGGVERIVAAQAEALRDAGHDVRIVAGSGRPPPGVTFYPVPLCLPDHPDVVALDGHLPDTYHPTVVRLAADLTRALADVDAVAVHNALTVSLNPALTRVLFDLATTRTALRFSIWCEDISSASRFVDAPTAHWVPLAQLCRSNVRFVTISRYRAEQLHTLFGLPCASTAVVTPPTPIAWLGLDPTTDRLVHSLGLMDAEPLLLTPAKLLPHKGLEQAAKLIDALRASRPQARLLITGAPSPHEPFASTALRAALQRPGLTILAAEPAGIPSHATVRDLMLLADAVFLPSHEEGFGLPLQEAALLRVPAVCADIPPFQEIGAGWATFFHPSTAPADLAQLALTVVDSPAATARRAALRSERDFRQRVLALL